jgi:transcriptional regulator GlxA family with amidase domain
MDKANLARRRLAEMPKSPRSSPNTVRVIDVLTYPAVQLLDVTGPIQVFASANDLVAGAGGARPYALRVVAQGGEGVTASAGLALAAGPLTPLGEALDTLYYSSPVARGPRRRPRTRCWSTGCGSGRRRRVASPPARRFPAVRVEPDPIFVCDGPIWTSAA